MEEFYRELGRILREKRARSGVKLTQQELADRVGLSRTSITNIELGKQHISLHMLYSFAKALDSNPQDLLPNTQFAIPHGLALSSQIDRLQISNVNKEILQKITSVQNIGKSRS